MTTPSSWPATWKSWSSDPRTPPRSPRTSRRSRCRSSACPTHKHSVLKLYGQQVKLFKMGRMPAQVLIDKAGIARFVHYGHDMSDIPENDEILGLVDEVNAAESSA